MTLDFKEAMADPISVDVGNRVTQGRYVSETIQFALFTSNKNAVWAANTQLQKSSYPYATLAIEVNRNLFRLQVGDCFKFSYAKYGIVNMICRVMLVEESDIESEKIIIHALEDIFGISSTITAYTAPVDNQTTPISYTEAPLTLVGVIEAPFVLSQDIKLIPIAARINDISLGYHIYMSIDAGTSYNFLETIKSFQPYGTLSGTYSIDTHSIDIEQGFIIDFQQGVSSINSITFSEVFEGGNTAMLGEEFISFQTITPVSGTLYEISNIIRGRFGSQKAAHAAGENFIFFKPTQPLLTPIFNVGNARFFKYVPYNLKQTGDITQALESGIGITGKAKKPYVPINFNGNGSSFTSRYDDDIILTWSPRYRGAGAGIGVPGIVLPSDDREGLFTVKVYVSSVLVRTTTSIDAATWTYTEAMNISDNGGVASIVVFVLTNYRVENGYTFTSDEATVSCKLN